MALDVLVEVGEEPLDFGCAVGAGERIAGLDVEGQRPYPHRTVHRGMGAHPVVAGVGAVVERILRRERTQPLRGEQVLADDAQHGDELLLVEHRVVQAAGDDHVGADEAVGLGVVYEIGQVSLFRKPEFFQKRRLGLRRSLLPFGGERLVARLFGQ